MNNVISFTPAELAAFIGTIAGVCAGIATIVGIIVKIIVRLKAPEMEQNNRVNLTNIQTKTRGMEVVYPLETPYTIDLPDGTPIKSLPGVNNIFADTGDATVKFRKIGD